MAQGLGGGRRWRTIGGTTLALVAFALNSLLGRAALADGSIDPASFTLLRLVSGAIVLVLLVTIRSGPRAAGQGSWISGLFLFAYATAFSFSYLRIEAGTGALVLMVGVQLTMFGAGIRAGERLSPRGWTGAALALAGLAYLVSPGVSAPSPFGSALMAAAGVAWGVYSLRGRGAADPLAETAGHFARAALLGSVVGGGLGIAALGDVQVTAQGAWLAIASGGFASGLGYAVWYAVLPRLTATRAGIVQLVVPVLVAAGGVLLLEEAITARLVIASGVILGGVGLALDAPRSRAPGA